MQQNLRERVIQALANTTPMPPPEPFGPVMDGEKPEGAPLSPPLQALGCLKDEIFELYKATKNVEEGLKSGEASVSQVLAGQYQMLENMFWTLAIAETGYRRHDGITVRGDWQLVSVPQPCPEPGRRHGLSIVIVGDARPFGFCRVAGGLRGYGREPTEI